jgi:hypothetical protein
LEEGLLSDLGSRQRDLIGGFRNMGVVDQTWQVDANSGSQGPMIGWETEGTETSTRSSALSNFRDFCCHRCWICYSGFDGELEGRFWWSQPYRFLGAMYQFSLECQIVRLEMLISWLQFYFCMMMRDSYPYGVAWTLMNNASGTQVSFQI